MIIQPKFRSRGSSPVDHCSAGRSLSGKWVLAILSGAIAAACSGTIETPSEEFPPRQAAAANGGAAGAAPAAPAPAAPAAPAPAANNNNNDEDDDAPAPSAPEPEDEEDPPPADEEEEPPAPVGDLSFENDVWPIFNAKCGPTCHVSDGLGGQNVGSEDIDSAFDDAVAFEEAVLEELETGGMPLGCNSPPGGGGTCVSEDEFATIESWYGAGAPE